MFETFFIGGQLWFKGSHHKEFDDVIYCFPVALIQNYQDTCYFKSNSLYSNAGAEKIKATSVGVLITDLPSYSSELTNKENFEEYLKFLFRNV